MGDIVPFTAQRTVEFGLAGTGFYLVNAAYNQLANEGIRVSRAAVERFVRAGADTVQRVVSHFRQQARAPRDKSSVEQKMGDLVGAKRPRHSDTKAPGLRVTPDVTIGLMKDLTQSKSVCKFSNGKSNSKRRHMKALDKWFMARWQSISKNPFEKLSLGMNAVAYTNAGVTTMYMPMYCFSCSDLPFNVPTDGLTKSKHKLESQPMYRLVKRYTTGSLTASKNYSWDAQCGLCNGPSVDFDGKADPNWHPQNLNCGIVNTLEYKPNYTVFDILMQCPKAMTCKMHLSLVQFKNSTGPARRLQNNQPWSGTVTPSGFTQDDDDFPEESNTDVFWECFWDKKTGHPLSQYNMLNRQKHIKFLKDEVVTITPQDSTVLDAVHFRHHKQIVVKDGTWYSTSISSSADLQLARDVANDQFGQLPPVLGSNKYEYSYGYNVVRPVKETLGVWDTGDTARERDVWLLIWMEDNSINSNGTIRQLEAAEYEATRPDKYVPTNGSCSFDIKVHRHTTVDNVEKFELP